MNDQRKVIFEQRKDYMRAEEVQEEIADMRLQVIEDMVANYIPAKAYAEQWEVDSLHEEMLRIFGLDLPVAEWAKEEGIADQEIEERLITEVKRKMAAKTANIGAANMRSIEKQLLLMILDKQWKDHLLSLDHLKQAVALRGYGQRDPLMEYKKRPSSSLRA